jgi:CopG family nickel-responsive transcriptional regulator
MGTLADLQHSHFLQVISSMHIHLDEHNCLEVIVLRGPVGEINKTAENIISLRGVKLGRINLLAAGVT